MPYLPFACLVLIYGFAAEIVLRTGLTGLRLENLFPAYARGSGCFLNIRSGILNLWRRSCDSSARLPM